MLDGAEDDAETSFLRAARLGSTCADQGKVGNSARIDLAASAWGGTGCFLFWANTFYTDGAPQLQNYQNMVEIPFFFSVFSIYT